MLHNFWTDPHFLPMIFTQEQSITFSFDIRSTLHSPILVKVNIILSGAIAVIVPCAAAKRLWLKDG